VRKKAARAQGCPAAPCGPLDQRFAKIATYEVYQVKAIS
jgi:hypothetical protein